jgi:hypothetical protein
VKDSHTQLLPFQLEATYLADLLIACPQLRNGKIAAPPIYY